MIIFICHIYVPAEHTYIRPCLISACLKKPIVASLPAPQKSASARLRGS